MDDSLLDYVEKINRLKDQLVNAEYVFHQKIKKEAVDMMRETGISLDNAERYYAFAMANYRGIINADNVNPNNIKSLELGFNGGK